MTAVTFESTEKQRRIGAWLPLLGAGLALIAVAVLLSNGGIERALVSNPARSLSWGPALFRILLGVHGLALIGAAFLARRRRQTVSNPDVHRSLEGLAGTSWRGWTALSLLSLLALGLRLWHLNTDLWFDEVLTLLNFVRLPFG